MHTTCYQESEQVLGGLSSTTGSAVDCYSIVLAGVSLSLNDRLQSVLNAAARLVFSARRSEHVTPLLCDLHWLKVPERIKFGLCVLAHGTAPPYETLQRTSDMSARRHLRSAVPPTLVVPSTRRSTHGDRPFPVAAARAWNSLLSSLRAVQSLTTFSRCLKAELFESSFT